MKHKKKLIIFMPSIEGGGVEKNLFIISNYLAKKIEDVILITVDKKYKNRLKNIRLLSPKSKFWDNVSRIKKYFICLFILLGIFFRKRDYIVLAFQANLYCTILCKVFGVNIIVRSNSSPSGWSKNIFKKFMYNKILNFADKVIVNSIDFKKQFKTFFSINAECIYNPLNKLEIVKKSKESLKLSFFKKNSLNIINIGRFTDQKDHLTLLKGINLLKNKINFRLLLIGRGINNAQIKNFIISNKLSKFVKIINFQINPYKYIKKADLFVLSSRYEGLPNVLLESAVLKKFIISTNCPTGPREILLNGKGGELVPVGDYKSLANKILIFCKKRSVSKNKINLTYKSLNRFDYNINLDKYYKVVLPYLN